MDRLDHLREKILPVLIPYGVKRVGVFGSYARGDDNAQSDIDILVELKPPGARALIGLKWFGLEEQLSRLVGRAVELVSASALSPHLRPFIEKDLIVLYEEV